MKLRAVAACMCILGGAAGASAAPPPADDDPPDEGWSPGSRTTSKLGAEIERRDERPMGDGVYGRLDGDMSAALHGGVAVFDKTSYAAFDLSLHYFWTSGAYLNLREGLGGSERLHKRTVGLGVEVRPLFLPRLALDMQHGPALLDLTLDSLSLGLGAYFGKPATALASERGLELSAGLSVPLFRSAAGPWIRVRAERRLASESGQDSETTIAIQLAWHVILASALSSP